MTAPWTSFETLYTAGVRAAADAWMTAGAAPPDDVRAEQVGELVLLRTTIDRSISPEDRLARLTRVGSQLLGPTSYLYDAREDDAAVVELIRARHGLVEMHRRRRPGASHTAALGEPILRGVHPGWPLLSMVLICGAALLVGYLVGDDSAWQLVAFAITGVWALVCLCAIARRPGIRVDRAGIHVRELHRTQSYPWAVVRDITLEVNDQSSPMGPSQVQRIVVVIGAVDGFAYAHERRRLPMFVGASPELRDELIAYGIASGARIEEMPFAPDNSSLPIVRMMAGIPIAALVAVVLSEWNR